MRATIVGLSGSKDTLREALAGVIPGQHLIRARGDWAWAALPADVRSALVEELATKVGRELVVVEVEMTLGGRGSDLSASRRFVPARSDTEEDLTSEVREILHEWTADTEGGFDEDAAIFDLAWGLIEEGGVAPAAEVPACYEDRWAAALVAHLVGAGSIELRGKLRPDGEVAHHLQSADEKDRDGRFAAFLLEVLIESTAVAEVYVDEIELEEALKATRPVIS
jgi:hypothetical protein